mmetsp:Transcript_24591/g.53688  ORF Transcript_24591/g.53688 Transcript_24591/m.53688 type:complete len:217 (-) Transcript_24591:53-703(-)
MRRGATRHLNCSRWWRRAGAKRLQLRSCGELRHNDRGAPCSAIAAMADGTSDDRGAGRIGTVRGQRHRPHLVRLGLGPGSALAEEGSVDDEESDERRNCWHCDEANNHCEAGVADARGGLCSGGAQLPQNYGRRRMRRWHCGIAGLGRHGNHNLRQSCNGHRRCSVPCGRGGEAESELGAQKQQKDWPTKQLQLLKVHMEGHAGWPAREKGVSLTG